MTNSLKINQSKTTIVTKFKKFQNCLLHLCCSFERNSTHGQNLFFEGSFQVQRELMTILNFSYQNPHFFGHLLFAGLL
ncbi:hypothetical protein BpHYR1_049904 [Brachionus plicatilis]|uniref:Uncharacterized protein n=1 Tax=Brachionus plicatilis TaxID=10195 RepID=A0A3M7QG27_BRAPC|nr:hypothetical protein BpHYR1_049904 [Brachionus plicatilis]